MDVSNLKISANGQSLFFSLDVYPDCKNIKCTIDKDLELSARGDNTWVVYDQIMTRHWDTWLTKKVSHIFSQSMNSKDGIPKLEGSLIDTMSGLNMNSPVPPVIISNSVWRLESL